MKVGDLVQFGPRYKARGRWAVIVECNPYHTHCKVMFMDTQKESEAIKSALMIYNSPKKLDI